MNKPNRKIINFDDYAPSPVLFGEKPEAKSRLSREFAIIPLPWLADRELDALLPARARLYLFLQYKTKRGARPWPLPNTEAKDLGLTPNNKMRSLRWLEARGLVVVTTVGKRTATVSVVRQPLLPK